MHLAFLPCWASLAICTAEAKNAEPVSKPLVSSDGLFETYSKPNFTQNDANGILGYYGERVYVRLHGSSEIGQLLRENDRWMNMQWVPKSHLLGVEDHWDGHESDVYIYEVSQETLSRLIQYKLLFKSPENDYDRKWSIEGWDTPHRVVHLRFEQRNEGDITFEKSWAPGVVVRHYSFVIGTQALSEKE